MELNECNCFRAVARLQNKTRQVSSAKGASPQWGLDFEIQRLRNALISIFHGIFLQKSQSWESVEGHFFIAQRYWCQVNDHLHFKAFEKPLLTVHMKRINLIKMVFPSIHPIYISWFYLNQSNFFQGLFSQLNVSSKKKRPKSRRGNCLALPHASYSPVLLLKAGFTSDDVRVRVLIGRVQHDDPVKTVF